MRKQKEEKYQREIKELKEEIKMLNISLSESNEGDWDHEGLYQDALNGTFNGNCIGGKPDKKYAKWLKQRYSL